MQHGWVKRKINKLFYSEVVRELYYWDNLNVNEWLIIGHIFRKADYNGRAV
jgi:hypothetical protein